MEMLFMKKESFDGKNPSSEFSLVYMGMKSHFPLSDKKKKKLKKILIMLWFRCSRVLN
jgi:hypothetical protein